MGGPGHPRYFFLGAFDQAQLVLIASFTAEDISLILQPSVQAHAGVKIFPDIQIRHR